jgi:hypothetical protein
MWQKVNDANRRWIVQTPLIGRYGAQLATELEQCYQTAWPFDSVRVDVVNYANWAGAFTTLYPTRITISSIDAANQNTAALKILFHEAPHGIVDKLIGTLHTECKSKTFFCRVAISGTPCCYAPQVKPFGALFPITFLMLKRMDFGNVRGPCAWIL